MNNKFLSANTICGKLMRLPLRLINPNSQVSILFGKCKGKRWIVGSGVHGYWIGNYEFEKQKIFSEYVKPGDIVYDVGANVGFYTLLASELVGTAGWIYSFEPVSENIQFLQKHLSINKIANVTVVESAVSDVDGSSFFRKSVNGAMGKLDPKGEITIPTIALDNFVANNKNQPPKILKIDIEGAELLALQGASRVIKEFHPVIFLATHGYEINKACCKLLTDYGYDLQSINGDQLEFSREILATYNS